MGTPEYAAVSLARLLDGPHHVRAVVTRPDKPRGRGQKVEPGPVRKLAIERGIEVLAPASARDPAFLARLREIAPDLGVVVAYGRILPREVLEAPRLGCLNAHGSVLPFLRGAAPVERAILEGFEETGVTIMQMNEGLDEGDILLTRSVPISDTMTGAELRAVLARLSADLFVDTLDRIASGDPPSPIPQENDAATFAPPLQRSDSAIRWSEGAGIVARRVRAFAPRPGAFALDGGVRLKIVSARPVETDREESPGTVLGTSDDGIVVACGCGALEILTVQPEGRRAMSALDYERGRRSAGSASRILDDGR